MKNVLKTVALSFAIVIAIILSGCFPNNTPPPVNETPEEQQLLIEEAIDTISSLFNFNSANFTAGVNLSISLSHKEGSGPTTTQSVSMENLNLRFENDKFAMINPSEGEMYYFGEQVIQKENNQKYTIQNYFTPFTANNAIGENAIINFDALIQTMIKGLIQLQPDAITATELDSGAYEISFEADFKQKIESIISAIINNQESTLEDLIDAVMQNIYGQEFKISNLLTKLKAEINSTSKVKDVLGFIEEELKFNITEVLGVALYEFSGPSFEEVLELNLFELIQIESEEAFAAIIDNFYEEYLQNPQYSLKNLIESLNSSEINQIFEVLSKLNINTFEIKFMVATNAARTAIEKISAFFDFDITIENLTQSVKFEFDSTFSNYGTTVVNLPSDLSNQTVEDIELSYVINIDEITQGSPYYIENVYLGDVDLSGLQEYNNLELTYDATNNRLIVSSDAVLELMEYNSLFFHTQDYSYTVSIYLS